MWTMRAFKTQVNKGKSDPAWLLKAKTSKQTMFEVQKIDFPPLCGCILIGLAGIITPWRCPKIETKKFWSFLEILE